MPPIQTGLNLNAAGDASIDRPFANLLRQGRGFAQPNGTGTVALDANSYPTADFGIYILSPPATVLAQGVYPLRFPGQADVSTPYGGIIFSTPAGGVVTPVSSLGGSNCWDAASNTTTMVATINGVNNTAISFTNTKRNPGDQPGTGMNGPPLMMRPISPGSTTAHGFNELFCRDYLATLTGVVDELRGMDWLATNNISILGGVFEWASRVKPSDFFQSSSGACLEYLVQLCNLTGCNLHAPLPDNASPDYMAKFLQTIHNGSDAFGNPCSPGVTPVNPGLLPALGVKVTWGNEQWNEGQGFYGLSRNAARALLQPATSPIFFDGRAAGDIVMPYRMNVLNTVNLGIALRTEFGDAAVDSGRAQAVLGCQDTQGDLNFSMGDSLPFFAAYWGSGGPGYVAGRPLNSYIRGVCLGGYRDFATAANYPAGQAPAGLAVDDGSMTLDQIFAAPLEPVFHREYAAYINSYGLEYSDYEACFVGFQFTAQTNGIAAQVNLDPRAQSRERQVVTDAADGGCVLLNHYQLTIYPWSAITDQSNPTAHPKYRALQGLSIKQGNGYTGVVPPFITDPSFESIFVGDGNYLTNPTGSAWTFHGGSGVSATNTPWTTAPIPAGRQVAWIQGNGFLTQVVGWGTGGTFTLTLQAAQRLKFPADQLVLQIDGVTIGTFTPPVDGLYHAYITPAFAVTSGNHTLSLIGTPPSPGVDCALAIDNLIVTPSGSPVIAAPVIPPIVVGGSGAARFIRLAGHPSVH